MEKIKAFFKFAPLAAILILASAALGQSGSSSSMNPGVSSVNGCTGVCTINTTQFVNGFTAASPGTLANLMSSSPCSSSLIGQYAVVSDLYGSTNDVLRCTSTGSTYYWRPQRTDYAVTTTVTGGSTTLSCLQSAPTNFYNGTLASNFNITLSATNCWPGATFEVASNVSLLGFGVTVLGLTGSTSKLLGASAHYTFKYSDATTGWQFYQ